MAKYYDYIPPHLIKWILKQEMFWVATAPLNGGLVNVSPKGESGMFHVIDENKVWYQDLTGSGSETMAHLRQPGNGRITIMFHSYGPTPMILRLWGSGIVHEFGTSEYDAYIPPEERRPGSRAAVVIDVNKVGTSCGYGVPMYEFQGHRPTLVKWLAGLEDKEQKATEAGLACAPDGLKAYWERENLVSLDGLPCMQGAHQSVCVPRYEQAAMGSEEDQRRFADALKARVSDASQQVEKTLLGVSQEELVRLVGVFSLGVAVTAGFVQYGRLVRQ